MKDFYSIEENFNFLYNDISTLLNDDIMESSLAENWLANWYVCNKYNTTKAMEKYAADLIIPKLKDSEIPSDVFKSIIDTKLNGCYESYNDVEQTMKDKLYMIKNVKEVNLNESVFSYIIQDFECDEIVSYINESFFDDNFRSRDNNIPNVVLNAVSRIKHAVVDNFKEQDRLQYVKSCNLSLLYKLKDVAFENTLVDEMSNIHKKLNSSLSDADDVVIEHVVHELNHINELIDYIVCHKLNESSEEFIYDKAIEEFNYLVENIFFDESDNDINLEQFMRLYVITEALCEYESTMEASSRIITKGTEKITKGIGNASAKGRGMSASDSKLGQLKRGAKIVDDRASNALNAKIDQIVNFTQEAKREKIINGRTNIKLGKTLKTVIAMIIAGKAVGMLPKQTIAKLPILGSVKAPLLGIAITIIGLLTARALSKATEEREKKRIMLELETELKITREKIEDAKGENAKQQKYQLMRIEAQLEKEILRIKHGMKYY